MAFLRDQRMASIAPSDLCRGRWTGTLFAHGRGFYVRTASYVDRILKGGAPSDLPVEEPASLELVINIKTAKRLA